VLGSGVPPDYNGRDTLRAVLVQSAPKKHAPNAIPGGEEEKESAWRGMPEDKNLIRSHSA